MKTPANNLEKPDQKPKANLPRSRKSYFLILLGVWLLVVFHDGYQYVNRTETIPYSQFISDLSAGKVDTLVIGNEHIHGSLKQVAQGGKKDFDVQRMEDPTLVDRVSKAGIRFEAIHESTLWKDLLSWIVPALVMVAVWSFFLRGMGGMAQRGMLGLGKSKARVYAEKGVPTRFVDVAGMDEAKQELQELVAFLKDPLKYGRLGGRVPKGVLLVGPPGTGKTLAARAVAGEAQVPFYSINGSEFVELFVGLGAARVRDLFAEARTSAPCIIFIDELDALGKMRGMSAISGGGNDEKEQTLNQLLAEIDGFDTSKGIVLLAATNRPEVLDPALLRSGRFDRQIAIDKPDRIGRRAILEVHLKSIHVAQGTKAEDIASLTAGFSGADLANLVNEAALVATRRGAESVENEDFTQAIERMVAGLERKTRRLNPEEKRRVAVHEMGHALLTMALGKDETVQKVSIIPRGIGALGYTLRMPQDDRYLMTVPELEDKLAILLGGRASEEVFLKGISTGAADDLDRATELARAMVTRYGMSDSLGLSVYERGESPLLAPQSAWIAGRSLGYSEATAKEIDHEIRSLLERAFERARRTLKQNPRVLEHGIEILFQRETLTAAEVKALWEEFSGDIEDREPHSGSAAGVATHLRPVQPNEDVSETPPIGIDRRLSKGTALTRS